MRETSWPTQRIRVPRWQPVPHVLRLHSLTRSLSPYFETQRYQSQRWNLIKDPFRPFKDHLGQKSLIRRSERLAWNGVGKDDDNHEKSNVRIDCNKSRYKSITTRKDGAIMEAWEGYTNYSRRDWSCKQCCPDFKAKRIQNDTWRD